MIEVKADAMVGITLQSINNIKFVVYQINSCIPYTYTMLRVNYITIKKE